MQNKAGQGLGPPASAPPPVAPMLPGAKPPGPADHRGIGFAGEIAPSPVPAPSLLQLTSAASQYNQQAGAAQAAFDYQQQQQHNQQHHQQYPAWTPSTYPSQPSASQTAPESSVSYNPQPYYPHQPMMAQQPPVPPAAQFNMQQQQQQQQQLYNPYGYQNQNSAAVSVMGQNMYHGAQQQLPYPTGAQELPFSAASGAPPPPDMVDSLHYQQQYDTGQQGYLPLPRIFTTKDYI